MGDGSSGSLEHRVKVLEERVEDVDSKVTYDRQEHGRTIAAVSKLVQDQSRLTIELRGLAAALGNLVLTQMKREKDFARREAEQDKRNARFERMFRAAFARMGGHRGGR